MTDPEGTKAQMSAPQVPATPGAVGRENGVLLTQWKGSICKRQGIVWFAMFNIICVCACVTACVHTLDPWCLDVCDN